MDEQKLILNPANKVLGEYIGITLSVCPYFSHVQLLLNGLTDINKT